MHVPSLGGALYNAGSDVIVGSAAPADDNEESVASIDFFLKCGPFFFQRVRNWYAYPATTHQRRHGAVHGCSLWDCLYIMTQTTAGDELLVYLLSLLKRPVVMSIHPLWDPNGTRSHYYCKHDVFRALSIYLQQ